MSGQFSQEWGVFPEDGEEGLPFTSVISVDVKSQGKALTEPVEKTGFAAYNKIEEPMEISCTLATMGAMAEMAATLEALEKLKRECVKVTVSTPVGAYDSLTLETFSHNHSADSGCGLLIVDLTLREVREVESDVTTESGVSDSGSGSESGSLSKESCKNSGSASKKSTGKAGTKKAAEPEQKKRTSVAYDMGLGAGKKK